MSREPRRWYDIQAAASKAVVRIYGDIGKSWWDDDATDAASLARDLEEAGSVSEIEVHLNSPGGVAFDGVAILNVLRDNPARVTVYVDGLAASAASIVAMAGDEIIMGRGAQLMIHDASIMTWGNAAQLRKDAGVLDTLSDSMAAVYADRAGGDAASWRTVMQDETWYTAQEAVDAGLADRVSSKDSADSDTANAAATLRASAVARAFRYQGRAEAPAPQAPARPGGQQDHKGGTVEITDEDFAALRSSLGLGEDATIGDVLTAAGEKQAQEAPAAKLPPGVQMIDADTLAELQSNAALGVEAHKAQVAAKREGIVKAALRDGKITAARAAHWRAALDADEEGTVALLDTLAPGLVPVTAKGHDDGTLEEGDGERSLASVRENPHYAALRGIV